MTLDDGKKLAAMLSDGDLASCTCWVCIKGYALDLQQIFPELHWGFYEKDDTSNEGVLTVTVPQEGTGP